MEYYWLHYIFNIIFTQRTDINGSVELTYQLNATLKLVFKKSKKSHQFVIP